MDNIQALTRKNVTCQDLLTCLYNLKPIDLDVFIAVAKNQSATLDQISASVERDRSSAHRCLSKLLSAGLIYKQSKGLKRGGYYHVYSIVEPDKIKEQAKQKIKEITKSLETLIENFNSDLNNHLSNAAIC